MKNLFIPAQSKIVLDKSKILETTKILPKEIAIFYSIQYLKQAKEIKEILSSIKKITSFKQVLGCSKPVIVKTTKAILLVSDGKFHAISLALETKLPVYVFTNNRIEQISQKEILELTRRKKASFTKFLSSNKVGILVSSKPGQENLQKAIELRKKLKQKETYLFLSNNINLGEFENFPQIESWINTACPRMDMNNSRIINIGDI